MTYEKYTLTSLNPKDYRVLSSRGDDEIPILFMFVGLPGSGKSTLAAHSVVNDKNGGFHYPVVHSSDKIREELYGDADDQEHNAEVFNELHKRIRNDLASGKDVIYDATNLSKKRRVGYLKELRKIRCKRICIAVMTPYEVCIRNNQNRDRQAPRSAMERMYKSWCPPALHEGFDEIHLYYYYGDLSEYYYSPENFFEGRVGANHISQENSHHTLTIGEHCSKAGRYAITKYSDLVLGLAAHFHDIGKPFTKTKWNAKGEFDGNYHYYQHHCVGAYDSLFYLEQYCNDKTISVRDLVYISNLIYYHMMPFTKWRQSEKAKLKDIKLIGKNMYEDIMRLHEADTFAH